MVIFLLYLGLIGFVGQQIINSIQTGQTTPIIAIGIISSFFFATRGVRQSGWSITRMITHMSRIRDLFQTVKNFDRQSFAVSSDDVIHVQKNLCLRQKLDNNVDTKKHFQIIQSLSEVYRKLNFWLLPADKWIKKLPIDFVRHPLWVYLIDKAAVTGYIFFQYSYMLLYALFPLMLAWAVSSAQTQNLLIVLLISVALELFSQISGFIIQTQMISLFVSIKSQAVRYLMQVDPIHHTTRNTGKNLSRI